MDFNEWLKSLPGAPSASQAADAAGVSRATAIRHSEKGHTTPEYAIAIARAFDVNEVNALIDLEYLDGEAVTVLAVAKALHRATNQQLLDEINTRVDPDSREKFRGKGANNVVDLRDDAPSFDPQLHVAQEVDEDAQRYGEDGPYIDEP